MGLQLNVRGGDNAEKVFGGGRGERHKNDGEGSCEGRAGEAKTTVMLNFRSGMLFFVLFFSSIKQSRRNYATQKRYREDNNL